MDKLHELEALWFNFWKGRDVMCMQNKNNYIKIIIFREYDLNFLNLCFSKKIALWYITHKCNSLLKITLFFCYYMLKKPERSRKQTEKMFHSTESLCDRKKKRTVKSNFAAASLPLTLPVLEPWTVEPLIWRKVDIIN